MVLWPLTISTRRVRWRAPIRTAQKHRRNVFANTTVTMIWVQCERGPGASRRTHLRWDRAPRVAVNVLDQVGLNERTTVRTGEMSLDVRQIRRKDKVVLCHRKERFHHRESNTVLEDVRQSPENTSRPREVDVMRLRLPTKGTIQKRKGLETQLLRGAEEVRLHGKKTYRRPGSVRMLHPDVAKTHLNHLPDVEATETHLLFEGDAIPMHLLRESTPTHLLHAFLAAIRMHRHRVDSANTRTTPRHRGGQP